MVGDCGLCPDVVKSAVSPHPDPPPLAGEGVTGHLCLITRSTTRPAYPPIVVPAKAGIHPESRRGAEKWVPAFAGTPDFLFLRGVADDGDHRVAGVFDVFGEDAGFERGEAGVVEVALDEEGAALVVKGAPDRHRLGPEAA